MIFIGKELPANEKIFTLVNLELADVLDSNIRLKPQMFDYLSDEEKKSHARGLAILTESERAVHLDTRTEEELIEDEHEQNGYNLQDTDGFVPPY